jgi:outer membrane receptor for ferrienterochelin and colicin
MVSAAFFIFYALILNQLHFGFSKIITSLLSVTKLIAIKMKSLHLSTLTLLLFFIVIFPVKSQAQNTDTLDFFDLTMEQLMEIPVTVASSTALSGRESPGIITLITQADISASGARDLIDVLRMVPGFEFGVDVQGVVGLGMRGNWGHEGKILIQIDGQEMNERLYATTQLGHHVPLEQIDRIEVIRGPGSAVYGGFAELAVINIITKKGKNISGFNMSTNAGLMGSILGRASATLMAGNESGGNGYDIKASYTTGNRSDRDYTDFYGSTYSMKNNSSINNLFINAGGNIKDLSFRFVYDNMDLEMRDAFGVSMPFAEKMNFTNVLAELKYNIRVSEKFTLTPKFNYKWQTGWNLSSDRIVELQEDDPDNFDGLYNNMKIGQYTGSLNGKWDFSENFNLISGVEYYLDDARSDDLKPFQTNGELKVSYQNTSLYAQGYYKTKIGSFTVGARFNNHEQFGSSFVPRLGYNKVAGNFHTKILISQAFRAPSILNIDSNPDIKPEKTTVFEVEAGYKLTPNIFLSANLFDITIIDPIVYFYSTAGEGYSNFSQSGSRGIETEIKIKTSWGQITSNYSFYSSADKNKVDSYEVPGNSGKLLGLPQHKLNLNCFIKINESISFNPTLSYIGKRYGFFTADTNDEPVLKEYNSALLINGYFQFKNFLMQDLTLGAGVYNIGDSGYSYLQPYNNYHSPLPAASREFLISLKYGF